MGYHLTSFIKMISVFLHVVLFASLAFSKTCVSFSVFRALIHAHVFAQGFTSKWSISRTSRSRGAPELAGLPRLLLFVLRWNQWRFGEEQLVFLLSLGDSPLRVSIHMFSCAFKWPFFRTAVTLSSEERLASPTIGTGFIVAHLVRWCLLSFLQTVIAKNKLNWRFKSIPEIQRSWETRRACTLRAVWRLDLRKCLVWELWSSESTKIFKTIKNEILIKAQIIEKLRVSE